MSKKRIDDDAFSFVRNTAAKETQDEKTNSEKKSVSAVKKAVKESKTEISAVQFTFPGKPFFTEGSERMVYVLYQLYYTNIDEKLSAGTILSVAEISKKYITGRNIIPFETVAEKTFADKLAVPGNLGDISDIHTLCVVIISNGQKGLCKISDLPKELLPPAR
jgi:hypothetical protein